MNWPRLLVEGLAIGCVAAGFCVLYCLIAERADRRRARYYSSQQKEREGLEREP